MPFRIVAAGCAGVIAVAAFASAAANGSAGSTTPNEKASDAIRRQPTKTAGRSTYRPLTAEEQATLAKGLNQMFKDKSRKLVEHVHQNGGGVSVDLDGTYDNVALARLREDGTVDQVCVDDRIAAEAFLGIENPSVDKKRGQKNAAWPVSPNQLEEK